MPLVKLQKVTRRYRLGQTSVTAVEDVDIEIDRGEFVALWGPSGSGKSTLCNLVGCIDLPSSGSVEVNGRNVADLSDDALSEHRNLSVGFVFQQFNLVPVLTALENVMLPLNLRGVAAREARAHAIDLLAELGIADFMAHRPDKLSGGQRQRVAIARALVGKPALVIADEPTANLDSGNALRIVSLMGQLNKSHGTTFIFATHDQRLLDRVSRRILLADGRVVEDTTQAGAR
ncbi:MAG: ABC transporter ATP-binding protein [Lentisphaerae bacterium]|nr:ABC transporter ATP-binding protein [Lentisphaerota bacterium]